MRKYASLKKLVRMPARLRGGRMTPLRLLALRYSLMATDIFLRISTVTVGDAGIGIGIGIEGLRLVSGSMVRVG